MSERLTSNGLLTDQFVFKKPTQKKTHLFGKHRQCHERTSLVLSAKMISTGFMMLRFLQFLLFAYFYNSFLHSALQEMFCFYDFHVFQLSWLRNKI